MEIQKTKSRSFFSISKKIYLIIGILGLLLATWICQGIVNNINRLLCATELVSKGDLNNKIESSSFDEIGLLVVSFNNMVDKRREMEITTRLYYDELEQRVHERTQELHETNHLLNKEIDERKLIEETLRKSQEMMIHSEKMLSVGVLAAGIAHDLSNPLSGILQSLQVIENRTMRKLTLNSSVAVDCGTSIDAIERYMEQRGLYKMFNAVVKSAQRAAKIVPNMHSFSHKGDIPMVFLF